MTPYACTLVLSTDSGFPEDQKRLQDLMLQRLFCAPSAHDFVNFLHQSGFLIPCDVKGDDYCELMECTCDSNKMLTKIEISQLDAPNWNVDWFPGTLWLVDMQNVHLAGQNLAARRLPRELRYFRMLHCEMAGELDMVSLPIHLRELHLGGNSFCGTVRLTCLPYDIRIINMIDNALHRVVVANDLLPEGLEKAAFYSLVKKVKISCLDSPKADARIDTNWLSMQNLPMDE